MSLIGVALMCVTLNGCIFVPLVKPRMVDKAGSLVAIIET